MNVTKPIEQPESNPTAKESALENCATHNEPTCPECGYCTDDPEHLRHSRRGDAERITEIKTRRNSMVFPSGRPTKEWADIDLLLDVLERNQAINVQLMSDKKKACQKLLSIQADMQAILPSLAETAVEYIDGYLAARVSGEVGTGERVTCEICDRLIEDDPVCLNCYSMQADGFDQLKARLRTSPAVAGPTEGATISLTAAKAAICYMCANPERYKPAEEIEGSQRLFHFQRSDNWNAGQCLATVLDKIPIVTAGPTPATPDTEEHECSTCAAEEELTGIPQDGCIDCLLAPSSVREAALNAAREIAGEYYFIDSNVRANWLGRENEVYEGIAAIISKHVVVPREDVERGTTNGNNA